MIRLDEGIFKIEDLCFFDSDELFLFAVSSGFSDENVIEDYKKLLKEKPLAEPRVEKTSNFSMELHLTEACNLRCRYCYLRDNDDKIIDDKCFSIEMSKKSIEKVFLFFNKNFPDVKNVFIGLFGGEPLLFSNLRFLLERARSVFKDKNIFIRVATNGTVMNEEIEWFLKQPEVSFGLSLDGNKKSHDYLRPVFDSSSSFDLIEKNLSKLKVKSFNVRTTVTPYNLDLVGSFDFFKSKGFKKVKFTNCTSSFKGFEIKEEMLGKFLDAYTKLADAYLNHILEDLDIVDITDFSFVWKSLHYRLKKRSYCGLGNNMFAVYLDEKMYSCHRFVGNEDFLIGDLDQGFYEESLGKKCSGSLEDKKLCQECFAKHLCAGGCAHENMIVPKSISCELKRHITYLAIKLYATLLIKHPEAFEKVKNKMLSIKQEKKQEALV